MRGDPEIIELLNDVLTAELTAINQYYVHAKMCQNWGYPRLAHKKREESIEEMRHADTLIERILYFEGIPNMQRLYSVRVGEDAIEQHELDLDMEQQAVKRLNDGIRMCRDKNDAGTAEILEHILQNEEEGIDWLEAQLELVDQVGRENYLAQQMNE